MDTEINRGQEVSGWARMDVELDEMRAEIRKLRDVVIQITAAYDAHLSGPHLAANRSRRLEDHTISQETRDSLKEIGGTR